MPAKPMLDQVELMQVDKVEEVENEVVAQHSVPALEGDFLQDLGRRASRVTLTGTLTGTTAADGLKSLREKFRAAEPVPFVEDIASATKVGKVLIEDMDVRELAGKPERFEYALTLLEFTPPPKPEPEPPPPSPPPPPKTDSGKLVVEVSVAGQPNADVSASILTVDGTQDDGTQLSRTLSNRTNNVWNDDEVPVGSYVAKATMAGSPAMVGTADTKISAGQTTQVSISLQPGALVAKEFVVHFRFDKAFVEPCMRDVLKQVIDHAGAHPEEKLVIVGHTDLVGTPGDITGPDPYNQSLSERRARAVYAFLTFGRDKDNALADWSDLRQQQTGQPKTLADNWGTRQYQHMLQDLGFYPGNVDGQEGKQTQDAVRAIRRKHGLPDGTTVDDDVWKALIGDYLGQDNFTIPDSQFFRNCGNEPLKWIGCASQDPVNRTRQAHRPNRRVELLFINTDKFPVSEPQPETFNLPIKGAVGSDWCMKATGAPQEGKRAAFVVPHQPPNGKPAAGQWTRQPAEPGTITVQVSIKKEVKKPDGSTDLQPVPGQKFVLIVADGEFKDSELTSGEPQPAVTKADGTQSFSDKPLGIYCLEVLAPVLVRLAEDDPASAKGNAVCKHLTADDNHLDVIILPDRPLREITLPTAVHLMTALTPLLDSKTKTRIVRTCPDPASPGTTLPQATAHKASEIPDIFAAANEIWRQGRIHFDPVNIVEESYAFRTECEVDGAELASLLDSCAYPNVANVFFFGDLQGQGELGMHTQANTPGRPDGCGITDRAVQIPPANLPLLRAVTIQTVAHELGHYLELAPNNTHPAGSNLLMHVPTLDGSNRTLSASDITTARGSSNAALEFVPLSLKVTSAQQVGGSLSHEFLVIQNSSPAPPALITVEAVITDATGSVSMSGGDPGASSQQRTVSTATKGVTEVDGTFTPSGGGTPSQTLVEVRVATLILTVDGAKQVGSSTTFVTKPDPKNVVVVTAQLDPAPFCIPKALIQWTNGDETPDPLCRSTKTNTTGAIIISATVAGVTKSVTIAVVEAALTSNADPFGAGVATAQIEGVPNQTLKSFDLPNLFSTQPRSLLRARATLPTVSGNTVQGSLTHKDSTGAILETIPITLTKKADAFLSLPILAIPIILKTEIKQKQPKTLEIVPAKAGDRLLLSVQELGGVSSAEVTVHARTTFLFAETFTDASTTSKDLKATAADIRRQIARANRIWAQAGVEIRERSVNDAVPDPGGLLQLDDNGTAVLTTDEQKLLGQIPGGPAHSATATDLNVYYVQDIKGAASGISFKGRAPRVTAMEGPDVSDAALAHEIGHWLLVGWGSPAGVGVDGNPTLAGDEHVDLNGKGWPDTNVMCKFDTNKDGNVDQTQVANILPSVSPVVVLP
jgi:outer membrane protein OmpA-like peptidoglycan-associated protein